MRCYEIANFFSNTVQTVKLNSVFEMLNFQTTEKVISLHIHFKFKFSCYSYNKQSLLKVYVETDDGNGKLKLNNFVF